MRFLALLDQEIADLERELETHPSYKKLCALRAARNLYVGGASTPLQKQVSTEALPRPMSRSAPRGAPMAGKSLEAVNATIEILNGRGEPMRTSELMPLLAERGITFSGSAPQNVLSSLLSRSDDVVSKGGHVGWALTSWKSAGDSPSAEDQSPAVADRQVDFLAEPRAQGREAGPGGGT